MFLKSVAFGINMAPHLTEFASDQYFEKLHRHEQDHPGDGGSTSTQPQLHQPGFIQPLGHSTATSTENEGAAKQKRSGIGRLHLSLRPRFHSRSSNSLLHDQNLIRRPSVAESTKSILPLDQLFQNLPNELQAEVIASLPLSDILSLRRTSSFFHALVTYNESPIVRHHLEHHVPAYAQRLYPPPEPTRPNLHYLCGLWHRLHVAAKLSDLMCEWITKEIFLRDTLEKAQSFAPQRERMRRKLIPLLFTVFHFFETYRQLHLNHIMQQNGHCLLREPCTINPIEVKILAMYDDQTLLRLHQVFPLVISSFCRRLRPPSYVGRVERSLRGYLRDKPADEVHVAILCLGGLRQVERLWEVKGYKSRRTAVDAWYNYINTQPAETEAKKRPGRLRLGRGKPIIGITKHGPANVPPAHSLVSGRGLLDRHSVGDTQTRNNLVFNTSMSAGMPMGTLSKDQYKSLLQDLPVLQSIFLETAEAIILEKKIVESPADIKRNDQVLLDLILEDGIVEDDQWWYGTIAPESVRPNLEAIREDALE